MKRLIGAGLSIAVALLITAGSANAQSRVALVIGNGAYLREPVLPRTVRDATEVAKSFERLGFSTIRAFDASYGDIRSAIRRFNDLTVGVEFAVVYFAGYGVEVRGENYLLPTDADLQTELDVPNEGISLHSLMQSVGRANALGLIILDASRDNPAVARMRGAVLARALNRGLARVEPGENVVVAYAARDGTVADDSGLYTAALLKFLETPGLDINLMFRKVRDEVMAQSNHRQQPFTYGSLPNKPIYLKEPSIFMQTVEPKVPPADETIWQAIRESSDSRLLSEFLEKYPSSAHAGEARVRLAALSQQTDRPAASQRTESPTTSRPNPPDGIEECDRLAASPIDRDLPKQVVGVELSRIDVAKAERACADAMARQPQVSRFAFEAARVAVARGDNAAARRLFETAAGLGNGLAMYSLGLIYAEGRMVPLDYREARRWYQKAVEQNSVFAMADLGVLYENGRGGLRDLAMALDLYRRAASAGDRSSMTRVGYFYENGLSVPKDYALALRWYRKGAELGDDGAMLQLAEMYENGHGIQKSSAEAHKWLERAKKAATAKPPSELIRSAYPVSGSSEAPRQRN